MNTAGGPIILSSDSQGSPDDWQRIKQSNLDALANANLITCSSRHKSGGLWSITGLLYDAVDSDFDEPDISFIGHITPLADISNLDNELKQRCLPILGAGASNPQLWDSAVRTAGVILEERLREIGGIADSSRVGRDLVNDVFGQRGTLADCFEVPSERVGYRDLYAGIVGAFRNPSAHRLIDPSPEDGGAFIVFVNLLLRHLDELIQDAR